ncbi:MAG: 2,3-bisphosphoglycerate-independent phosphoglycerate mutase [Nanoarchaeota archaeon]|nr:2,3-bisphosphoglycerate-independent phosphoglycerate mutase [Nanoarchaeota archaeon]
MKGILVILDGAADLPNGQLNEQTPLEAANMPNLNFLAARGELGLMNPVKPGFIPESDEAIVSIFGNDLISSTRGQLEAVGAGIKLTRGDLALRSNFATIDSLKGGNILDRRAGRTLTTEEAEILAKELNKKIKLSSKFIFKPTIQHRGVLVLRGGLSDNFSGNDISYYKAGRLNTVDKIKNCIALDDDETSQYTVNMVNEFIREAYAILNIHPVNEARRKKGLMPANFLLVRGGGIENPKLIQYKKWLSIAYMPLEIGFSKLSGMNTFSFEYPELKEMDVYENLYEGLKKACDFSIKTIEGNYKKADYAYIHIKETDIPGHDNKPLEKKAMLEYIDKTLFLFLKNFAPPNEIKVLVTCDHTTPCRIKSHSADPVPVLLYNMQKPEERRFTEKEAKSGSLGKMNGNELFKKAGFLK